LEYVVSWKKIFLLYPYLGNLTTLIAIMVAVTNRGKNGLERIQFITKVTPTVFKTSKKWKKMNLNREI
jgi:hypothetical protein